MSIEVEDFYHVMGDQFVKNVNFKLCGASVYIKSRFGKITIGAITGSPFIRMYLVRYNEPEKELHIATFYFYNDYIDIASNTFNVKNYKFEYSDNQFNQQVENHLLEVAKYNIENSMIDYLY